jgi:hypothetical protein
MSLSHRALVTPCGGQVVPAVRRLLRHIGAAGFRVKRTACQEAVRLGGGRVLEEAWLSTFVFPESVQELQRWDKTFTTIWISRKGGKTWNNLTGLHRALTSTPSNTFGMNWNADCKPSLITQQQRPTSQMLMWLNGSKSLQQCSNI